MTRRTVWLEKKIRYRLWLKLRVGKALATEETVLTASVAGREVTIVSERQSQPLSKASWLLIECRGFEAEDDARDFGEKLRRAVHLAGLCARVGVDAGDPGEDRTVSWVNPKSCRSCTRERLSGSRDTNRTRHPWHPGPAGRREDAVPSHGTADGNSSLECRRFRSGLCRRHFRRVMRPGVIAPRFGGPSEC